MVRSFIIENNKNINEKCRKNNLDSYNKINKHFE